MRAAAQLARPVAEAHDPDDVAVLLLEQVHRALGDRFLVRFLTFVKGKRLTDLVHHTPVDPIDLFLGQGAIQRDVERGVVRTDP